MIILILRRLEQILKILEPTKKITDPLIQDGVTDFPIKDYDEVKGYYDAIGILQSVMTDAAEERVKKNKQSVQKKSL